MNRFTVTYLALIVAATSAIGDEANVADRIKRLNDRATWNKVGEILLQFDIFHPQGMAIVNGEIFVSTVEVIDRAKGVGKGHVYKIAPDGTAEAHIEITDGPRYHPGGMDYDGEDLIVPVAEYRPDSTSVVYALNPATLQAKELFRLDDHLGCVIHNGDSGAYAGMSWGSMRFYQWTPSGAAMKPTLSRPRWVEFQDGQWLRDTNLMLCGGLRSEREQDGRTLGMLEVIEMRSLDPKQRIAVPLWETDGRPMLQNAFHCEATETGLRFWFLPGDGQATIYIYEPAFDDSEPEPDEK